MARYRLTQAAQNDITEILAWTNAQFGDEARLRYQGLLVAAIRDVADRRDGLGATPRPELGDGIYSWHVRRSRARSTVRVVHHSRHFLIYRLDGEIVVIGRVLHDAMELRRHLDADTFAE